MRYGRWIAHLGVSKLLGLLIASSLLSAIALAQAQAPPTSSDKTASATQEKTAPSKSEPSASDYVGSETCKTCHAEVFLSLIHILMLEVCCTSTTISVCVVCLKLAFSASTR